MDATTIIVSAVKDMASTIAAILGCPEIDTTVTVNGTTVFDEEVEQFDRVNEKGKVRNMMVIFDDILC